MRLSCTVMEMSRLKYNGVTSLTFWGHVTSSVTKKMQERKKKEEGEGKKGKRKRKVGGEKGKRKEKRKES